MANGGIKHWVGNEHTAIAYDQIGMDMKTVTDVQVGGEDYVHLYAGAGTSSGHRFYFDLPSNHGIKQRWIGIHNAGTKVGETVGIQAVSMVGDDFSTSGTFDSTNAALYIEIQKGDTVYGSFSEIAMRITSSNLYIDTIRLIRGV